MALKTYDLEVAREGRWWIVTVPEIGYRTQARTLAEVEEMGRDLIAGALGVDPGSFELAPHVHPPADVAAQLAAAEAADRAARVQAAAAARDRRAAVAKLRSEHSMSAADTARLLGVTRGRVHQLLTEARTAGRP
jgi:DNA-directed RNA polymerase specialized sigma24 family protein